MRIAKHSWFFAVLAVYLSACAIRQPTPVPEARRDLGVVGVVPTTEPPSGELDVGPRGAAAGALRGAAKGAAWIGAPTGSGCAGESCAVVLVLWGGLALGGALVGGVMGAANAVPVDTAGQIETQLRLALAEVGEQEVFRKEIVKAAARSGIANVVELPVGMPGVSAPGTNFDARELARVNVTTVLEVGVPQVGLVGKGGSDPQLSLHVHAVARLVDARSNSELDAPPSVEDVSQAKLLSEWTADEAHLIKQELVQAYERLAMLVIEDVFYGVRSN
jgi:hypothetical protein